MSTEAGIKYAGHQGGGIGFTAQYLVVRSAHLGAVVLANLSGTPVRSIAMRLLAVADPKLRPPVAAIIDSDPGLTATLRRVIVDAAKGEVDDRLFDAGARNKLVPFMRYGGFTTPAAVRCAVPAQSNKVHVLARA